MDKFHFVYNTEAGDIFIIYNEKGVCEVKLPYDNLDSLEGLGYRENAEIRRYFDSFFLHKGAHEIALDINVTSFQKKVYDILSSTKRGSVLTYGDIGRLIGCGSARAVGQALRKNPVPIIIPCHRVVGKNWDGGFGGETAGEKMVFKKFLLELEKR